MDGGVWRHQFDTQAVDWGFDNGHEWVEGGICFDFHGPWFCSGGAELIIEASPEWDPDDALIAFAYRMQRLGSAPAGEVTEFLAQFGELASLQGDEVVVKSCNGSIAIRINADSEVVAAGLMR